MFNIKIKVVRKILAYIYNVARKRKRKEKKKNIMAIKSTGHY
jgi:hypothetical protein